MRTAATRVRLKGTDIYVSAQTPSPAAAMSDPSAPAAAAAPAAAYRGASVGRRLGHWRPTGAGPNAIVSATAPEMVRRSRDLARNNLHGRRALSLYKTHIIGMGIVPRSLCPVKEVRDTIHQLWADWVDYADADGAYDFYGLQTQMVGELVEGGEGFARLRPRRAGDGLPVPLQIQVIPTEQVPLDYAISNGSNPVLQGIERDALGRRVAYWMHRQHPGDTVTGLTTDAWQLSRIDASDICHLRLAPAGQLRGLPWLAVAISTLQQLGDWKDAALLRKQLIASLVAFVRRSLGQDISAEEMAAVWQDVQKGLYGEMTAALEPGTVQYLMPGEEVEFTSWQETSGADEVFERSNLRSVAAGLDLIYEELSGDWSDVNDRTFRAHFNGLKRRIRQYQHQLVGFQFNLPVYRRWIDAAVASGALRVPAGMSDADLKRVEWRPERWEYINPKQDIDAEAAEVAAGFTSREAKVAERGDDVEVVDQQRARDQERERSLGLSQTRPTFSPDPGQEDSNDAPARR